MAFESMRQMLGALMQDKLQSARMQQQQQYLQQSPEYQQGVLALKQQQDMEKYRQLADMNVANALETGEVMSEEAALQNQALRKGGPAAVEEISMWLAPAKKIQEANPNLNLAGAIDVAKSRPGIQSKAEEVSQTTMAATGAKLEAEREGAQQVGETEDIIRTTTWPQRKIEMEFEASLRRKQAEASGSDNRAWLSFQKNRENTWAQIEKNVLLKDGRTATQDEVDEARGYYMDNGVLPKGFRNQILFKAPGGKVPTEKIYKANLDVMKAYLKEHWKELPESIQDDYGSLIFKNDTEKAAIVLAGNKDLILQMPEDVRDQLETMNAYQTNANTGSSVTTPLLSTTPPPGGIGLSEQQIQAYKKSQLEKGKSPQAVDAYIEAQLKSGAWKKK